MFQTFKKNMAFDPDTVECQRNLITIEIEKNENSIYLHDLELKPWLFERTLESKIVINFLVSFWTVKDTFLSNETWN